MRAKTDDELYLLLRVHSDDYDPEAIWAAQEELAKRQEAGPTSRREKMLKRALMQEESVDESSDAASWSGLGYIFVLSIIGAAIFAGYKGLDSLGWISHREETVISAGSDWLVGESKDCWSVPLGDDGAALFKDKVGYAMSEVNCDDGPTHKMKVTFYGRIIQPEYKAVSWRCTRSEVSILNDNSFTCYETGGQR